MPNSDYDPTQRRLLCQALGSHQIPTWTPNWLILLGVIVTWCRRVDLQACNLKRQTGVWEEQ